MTSNPITLSTATFREQMRWLSEEGIGVISLAEARQRLDTRADLSNRLVLTFDDGYRDFLIEAIPIMQEFGFTATVFVISQGNEWAPDPAGRVRLSIPDIREVDSLGYTVGSHSATHAWLHEQTPEVLETEVRGSKVRLEDILGHEVPSFAYPFGRFGKREAEAVQRAGYDYALGTRGVWGNGYSTGRFEMSRFIISRNLSLPGFASMVRDTVKPSVVSAVFIDQLKRVAHPTYVLLRRRFWTQGKA